MVDFWSSRAGPSLRQREMLTRLAAHYRGRILLVTVNTEKEALLVGDLGIRTIPQCRLYRHGRVVETIRGVQPETDYRAVVERLLGSSGGEAVQRALEHWRVGRSEEAIQGLARAAMDDPENLDLPLLLSKLLAQSGRLEDARAVLASLPPEAKDVPAIHAFLAHLEFLVAAQDAESEDALQQRLAAGPEDLPARFRLASLFLVRDDYEGAMEQLLEILRRDPGFDGGKARRGMLSVFGMLDPDDSRLKRYRSEFFRIAH